MKMGNRRRGERGWKEEMHPSSQGQTHYYGRLPSVLPIRAQSNILLHYTPISAPYQPQGPKGLASTVGRGNVSSAAICGDGRTYWKSKQEQKEGAEGRSLDSGQAPLWPGITALWKEEVERGELVHCTHITYCTWMCQCVWVNLLHTGIEIQASTFFKSKPVTWDFSIIHTDTTLNFQKHRPGSAESDIFRLRNQTAVEKQRNNKRTKTVSKKQGQKNKHRNCQDVKKKTLRKKTDVEIQCRLLPINLSSAWAAHCFPLSRVY